MNVDDLDFILKHLKDPNSPYDLFPRRITTKFFENKQITVESKDEALVKFNKCVFDCKISAFPLVEFHPPNFAFIDLDASSFNSKRALTMAMQKTVNRINGFGYNPTVLMTGGGYHIYMPLDCSTSDKENLLESFRPRLEQIKSNSNIIDFNTSNWFLRFMEQYLSGGLSDPNHNPSIKSCMIRIPNSINSKNNFKVKIIKEWDEIRFDIGYVLPEFIEYVEKKSQFIPTPTSIEADPNNHIYWIDELLKRPLDDYRKHLVWAVICPYLTNVRGLSQNDAIHILNEWLTKCNKLKKLDFNSKHLIITNLSRVKNYRPLSRARIQSDNPDLFEYLRSNGIF